jgi:hypothetical protein
VPDFIMFIVADIIDWQHVLYSFGVVIFIQAGVRVNRVVKVVDLKPPALHCCGLEYRNQELDFY